MPLAEHSDPWGYNPRQYFAIHSLYGTPDDLRRLVDRAHGARAADAPSRRGGGVSSPRDRQRVRCCCCSQAPLPAATVAELKLCVVVDVVLHHGAPDGNTLWEYDGWSEWGCAGCCCRLWSA